MRCLAVDGGAWRGDGTGDWIEGLSPSMHSPSRPGWSRVMTADSAAGDPAHQKTDPRQKRRPPLPDGRDGLSRSFVHDDQPEFSVAVEVVPQAMGLNERGRSNWLWRLGPGS